MIYPADHAYTQTYIVWGVIVAGYFVGGIVEGHFQIMMQNYFGVSWVVYGALGKGLSTFLKYFM